MTTEGKKFDQGKLRWTLVPWGPLKEVVQALMHGSRKYGDDNWKLVSNAKARYKDALQRHVVDYLDGEMYDQESGLKHLAHAICCALFLIWFENKDMKTHDRSFEGEF